MHAHDFTGMEDIDIQARGGMLGQFGRQSRLVSDQCNREYRTHGRP